MTTRTVVTVHPIFSPEFTVSVGENARVIQHAGTNVVCYDATDFIATECGALVLMDSDRPNASGGSGIGPFRRVAVWAPGTWARAEVTEAPAAPAEPDAQRGTEAGLRAAAVEVRGMVWDDDGSEKDADDAAYATADRLDRWADQQSSTPEEPAGPGTFEVYEDNAGKYRYRLKAHNGEVIASGQEYSTRGTALLAARIVMDAAKGAPIVDVDGDDQ